MQYVDISAAMDPNEEAQKYAKSKGVKLVFKTYIYFIKKDALSKLDRKV